MILGELSILLLPTLHFAILPIIAGAILGGAAAAGSIGTAIGITSVTAGAILGGGIGAQVHGAGQAAEATRDAARKSNEATERAWAYNVDLWEMEAERLKRDRDFKYETVEIQARNELKSAAYRDAIAAQAYNRDLQIRSLEQASLDAQFAKSNDIYQLQTGFNAQSAAGAMQDELRQYQEITAESVFDKQEARIEYLEAEGRLRARGTTGRSADKVSQSAMAKFGYSMAVLEESMANASRNTRAALEEIGRDQTAANLAAYANKMLDPGILPEVPVPFATPLTEWQYPEELQDFDYGPIPVLGAMKSPSAQSNMVWGQAISSIGSSLAAPIIGNIQG
jgi:hypothetical protein